MRQSIPLSFRVGNVRLTTITLFWTMILGATALLRADENLLSNPGFESGAPQEKLSAWTPTLESAQSAAVSETTPHGGKRCLAIPAQSAVEQRIDKLPAGAYLASCWVKSETAQKVTVLLTNPIRPWATYNCAEIPVPAGEWTRIEAFSHLDRDGTLTMTIGGMSQNYRFYHGDEAEMKAPILVDDCALVLYKPNEMLPQPGTGQLVPSSDGDHCFSVGRIQGRVRNTDGALSLSMQDGLGPKSLGIVAPVPGFKVGPFQMANSDTGTSFTVSSVDGDLHYTIRISQRGIVTIEPGNVSRFKLQGTPMSYGLLPSFVGSDTLYAPTILTNVSKLALPSTQWFVGLIAGGESMLTAVWGSPNQAVMAHLSGAGDSRVIDSLELDTSPAGFSVSYASRPGIWHRVALKEDYLGDYTPIDWERPFPARWMAHFFCSPGGKPSFHSPYNSYSFPISYCKTRMWGVWFEDWNHYPFYFDGAKTVAHFEKSFAPAGDALIYFLEPAVADLVSPYETVIQALGREKAEALFDFDGNGLRRLKYSTPPDFLYDRPVCATTTRLSKIKKEEKPTVGVNLATHLYEFIREIRSRVDQYSAYFDDTKQYLANQGESRPDLKPYLASLETLVSEAQARSKKTYETSLTAVQAKIEAMKKQLEQGEGDGYNCGNLDVRSPAGEQDDLCRRYNRLVLRLVETAMLNCGDSRDKAVVARHLWEKSRAVLREPTRWEPRRTLYFFEP